MWGGSSSAMIARPGVIIEIRSGLILASCGAAIRPP